jgi:hypothetical protein
MFYILFITVAVVSFGFGLQQGYGMGLATGLNISRHARQMLMQLQGRLAEKEDHHGGL